MDVTTQGPAPAIRIETEPGPRPEALLHVPLRRIDPGPLEAWGFSPSLWLAPGRITLLVLASQLFTDQQARIAFFQSAVAGGRVVEPRVAFRRPRGGGSVLVSGEASVVPEGGRYVMRAVFTPREAVGREADGPERTDDARRAEGPRAEGPRARPAPTPSGAPGPAEVPKPAVPPPRVEPPVEVIRARDRDVVSRSADVGMLISRIADPLALPEVGRTAERVRRFLEWVMPRRGPLVVAATEGAGARLLAQVVHEARGGDAARVWDAELESGQSLGIQLDGLTSETDGGSGIIVRRADRSSPEAQARIVSAAGVCARREQEGPLLYVTAGAGAPIVRQLVEEGGADAFTIPPLKERPQDVIQVLSRLLRRPRAGARLFQTIHPEAAQLLQSYDWPGGVAELQEVAESARLISGGAELRADDLPVAFMVRVRERPTIGTTPVLRRLPASIHGRRGRPEKKLSAEEIRHAIEACGGRRAAAAKMLGVSRTTLWRKIAEIGERLFDDDPTESSPSPDAEQTS